eukprot:CAMPEP_0181415246 /NCGR_PEP_ID=MMETSP1110-20121109/9918_1 /TAXON_ID=174948 /ORGANISM="Symbiodinium sp., Strain CCMP421" /LENGTH=59 /DNA_ID=CAMNT_0023538143 /DNA_START=192 /DNA_END=371 /DNA_ORIENTATION=-
MSTPRRGREPLRAPPSRVSNASAEGSASLLVLAQQMPTAAWTRCPLCTADGRPPPVAVC